MHQPARDLFGEVPISQREIDDWLRTVAGIEPDSPRAAHYVRAWRVTEKIAQQKLAGQPAQQSP